MSHWGKHLLKIPPFYMEGISGQAFDMCHLGYMRDLPRLELGPRIYRTEAEKGLSIPLSVQDLITGRGGV